MKKKIRCPECGGDDSHITMWRNGSHLREMLKELIE